MRFADIRTEWRVDAIESTLSRKAESYEVSSISSSVDRLERSLREISSNIDGLQSTIQTIQDKIEQLERRMDNNDL